ncbi:phosphate regulon sensor histidine kinase PhoR [Pseudaeromonas sharmana]|uniref:Phosphate regulon sensor protein PhoR n=1 Tax=Pseudaeromonas sharmana TaxID=328412 RepID=A0ABV8CR22_9GAMM
MLEPYSWGKMIRRSLYLIYSPALLVGLLTGFWAEALLASAVFHLLWLYYYQKKLADWLWKDRSLVPPQGPGTWELIFNGIYRLQQRHRARRRELAGVIRRFREGAEALPDAAVVCRNDGSIVWCNRLAGQLLGFRWPEDAGQNISNLIRNPAFVGYLKQADFSQPLEIVSPVNEERILEFRIMPYTEDQTMIVVRDVTHLRSLDAMRKNFVANVSHELRTPLTVLKGYLEMAEDLPPAPMWHKMHGVMLEQTLRMDTLVNQLLTLSRIEAATDIDRNQVVDVPAMLNLLEHEARALSGSAAHRIEFSVDTGLRIYGDREQLRSALTNLVNNAIKYTPPGKRIQVRWQREGARARFSVQDEGEGIAKEHLDKLTERFYRVDKARSRQTGGAGLGLAIVKHALSHHDCQLEVESQPGKGSCFSFTIPASLLVREAVAAG